METKKNKLAILAHFMEPETVYRVMPFTRLLPFSWIETILWHLPPRFSFLVVSHFDILEQAEGYIIGIALTPRQMVSDKKEVVRKKLLAATLYAQEKLGTNFLMLGGLTAPASSAGLVLTENPKVKLNITTGNAYTAAISLHSIYKAAEKAKLNLADITVAVIGAAGTIGDPICRILNRQVKNLIMVGRDPEKLKKLAAKMEVQNYATTINVNDINAADIILTATSHPDALIDPLTLKHKAIVIDVAEPSDMPKDFEMKRPDVTNIDGGRVKWPDINVNFNLGIPRNVGFACITEGLMQTLENNREHHVGTIDLDYLRKTEEWGKKYNWSVADFTSFNKQIPESKFE